jgi:transcriptional regulator with XRE-family HTH domain
MKNLRAFSWDSLGGQYSAGCWQTGRIRLGFFMAKRRKLSRLQPAPAQTRGKLPDPIPRDKVAARLKAQLEKLVSESGLEAEPFARKYGIGLDNFKKMLGGKTSPRIDTVFEVARLLDATLDWLVDRENAPRRPGQWGTDDEFEKAITARFVRAIERAAPGTVRSEEATFMFLDVNLFTREATLTFLENAAIAAAKEHASWIREQAAFLDSAIAVARTDEAGAPVAKVLQVLRKAYSAVPPSSNAFGLAFAEISRKAWDFEIRRVESEARQRQDKRRGRARGMQHTAADSDAKPARTRKPRTPK